MGLVVDRVGIGGKLDRDTNAEAITACSTKTTDDPVVYQLVRVGGDGSLVPATDDELMEVEQLLEHDRNQMPSTQGPKHTERCFSTEALSLKKSNSDCSKGLSHSDITVVGAQKLNSRLEYTEVILQKVKQEERQRLSCESILRTTNVVDGDSHSSDQNYQWIACDDKLPAENISQDIASHSTRLNGSHDPQLSGGETCPEVADKQFTCMEPTSICSAKLGFSMLKGEACLDNLTIRELQQVFLSTYGRETTVKDKMWLKRRIGVGLTESNRSLDAEEKGAVHEKLGQMGESKANILYTSQDTRSMSENRNLTSQTGDVQVLSNKNSRKPGRENGTKNDYLHLEQTATKRLRKPTKRFIEELSEAESRECSGRPFYSAKDYGSHNKQAGRTRSQNSNIGTRLDSLGGSGVQMPYVQRVRREQSWRDISTLMQMQDSCSMDKPTKVVTQGLYFANHDGRNGSMICRARSIPMRIPQRNAVGIGSTRSALETCDDEILEHGEIDSAVHNRLYSDINSATVSKYGARRKHHRAWSLSEVLKLIDGVAKYGAGRWSEIKKVAFPSYTHRTSVDLKDKWRNLLRASLAQAPDMPKNIRKHSSTPLPASILLRVRELAKSQSQSGIELSFTKSISKNGDIVQQKGSEFL